MTKTIKKLKKESRRRSPVSAVCHLSFLGEVSRQKVAKYLGVVLLFAATVSVNQQASASGYYVGDQAVSISKRLKTLTSGSPYRPVRSQVPAFDAPVTSDQGVWVVILPEEQTGSNDNAAGVSWQQDASKYPLYFD